MSEYSSSESRRKMNLFLKICMMKIYFQIHNLLPGIKAADLVEGKRF